MTLQVVKPAGAGYETIWVLALCAAIVAMAGAVVFVRAAPAVTVGVQAHQFDARRDLSAAEQGLYADLRVAADEILFMADTQGSAPAVAQLVKLGLPPFVDDASAARRGGHRWQRVGQGSSIAYLGLSAEPDLAGSLLLRLSFPYASGPDGKDGDVAVPDIWLSRHADAQLPENLDDVRLLAAGWRQVAAQFDAGVTRQHR